MEKLSKGKTIKWCDVIVKINGKVVSIKNMRPETNHYSPMRGLKKLLK